ncbi:MAG: ribonuclease T [Cellvibrionaceae bacterium]|nr:ribonuclease T [Cellvibrionaceae bacterium]
MADRFRNFLPVVIDVETGGFNSKTDALLEVAAATLSMRVDGTLCIQEVYSYQVEPFANANIEQSALEFTGIDLDADDREAEPEAFVLQDLFKIIRQEIKQQGCSKAVMVAHNAHFDLGFINAAAHRCKLKRNPFHPFSCFDTASLAGLAVGHTVLAKACELAGVDFNNKRAHTAAYDAQKTAELFCFIVNRWQGLGGWPLEDSL